MLEQCRSRSRVTVWAGPLATTGPGASEGPQDKTDRSGPGQTPPRPLSSLPRLKALSIAMPTPFSSQDLSRGLDARSLTRGRSLVLAGAVEVRLEANTITATVEDAAGGHAVRLTPAPLGRRVVFDSQCSCGARGCPHLAATGLAALDRFPALRKPEQQSFLDTLVAEADRERYRMVFEVAPGQAPTACVVATWQVGVRSGCIVPTTPRRIAADPDADVAARDLARLVGGDATRTPVPAARVADVLQDLARSGLARWHAGGQTLVAGPP